MRAALTRNMDKSLSSEARNSVADAAVSRMSESTCDELNRWDVRTTAAAETRAVDCFCTHVDVRCSQCHVMPIRGPRYSTCTSPSPQKTNAANVINLCERCRRVTADASVHDDCDFVIFDHPWEASDEYTAISGTDDSSDGGSDSGGDSVDGDGGGGTSLTSGADTIDSLRAPPPPLRQGDVGPRVLHLHYLLYKIGYLSVGGTWFKPGVFCSGTTDAMTKFQTDYWMVGMAGDLGVYNVVTRSVLLSLLDELERRAANVRCSAVSGAEEPRLRMALAA